LSAGCLAALEILARPLGVPSAGLLRPSVDAPLDELCNCVLLRVVIVRFHQRKHLAIIAAPLTKRAAVLALFQLDDPDTLAGRTAVLLDNPRLVSHRFLEAFDESRILVVRQRILEADVQLGNFGQRVLRTHEFHHVRRRPRLDAFLLKLSDGVVELRLAAAVCVDLPGVTPHDQRVKVLADLEEGVMLLVLVMDELAAHASVDHPVGEGNRVVAVAVAALVAAAVGLASHVDLK